MYHIFSLYTTAENRPSFENCYIEAIGPNGEKKTSSSTSHQCSTQADFYGNFHPVNLHYNLMVHFDPGFSTFPTLPPYFVTEYKFGVAEVWYRVIKIDAPGKYETPHEKTCLWSFRPGPIQTGLYNHRRWPEACHFVFWK